jgi:hypothetical protein
MRGNGPLNACKRFGPFGALSLFCVEPLHGFLLFRAVLIVAIVVVLSAISTTVLLVIPATRELPLRRSYLVLTTSFPSPPHSSCPADSGAHPDRR